MVNSNGPGRKSRVSPRNGAVGPDIVLPAGHGWTWSLHDLRGQPVVLAFYPADWEPVSADQLRGYHRALSEVHGLGAELVGVSVDSLWCHHAFARELRLGFRLLSDSHPRGAAARAYGVYRPQEGISERALFVIDAMGLIRWHYLAPMEVNPGVDGMLTALEGLADKQAPP